MEAATQLKQAVVQKTFCAWEARLSQYFCCVSGFRTQCCQKFHIMTRLCLLGSGLGLVFLQLSLCWAETGTETCAPGTRRHPSFPPFGLSHSETAEWFKTNLAAMPKPPEMSAQEKQYARWSAVEYISARRAGQVTCEEYAAALIKRVRHYKDMNQFMHLGQS